MKTYLILFALLILPPLFAHADDMIPITQSSGMDRVEFDGKWTNESEWKPTALYDVRMNNNTIYFRSAHENNFVYIMIDAVPDIQITDSDYAMICFDTNNDKSKHPDGNDFCFSASQKNNSKVTLAGTGKEFVEIKNHDDFVAIGAISDYNDRYSKIPHASYEFKIPLELIGRSDAYGFYFMINDENNAEYFWPSEINTNPVNSPDKWGTLVSPDKSLPEFSLVYLILALSLFVMIVTSKYSTKLFNLRNSII